MLLLKSCLTGLAIFFLCICNAQELRTSLFQYQMNALSLNPAFSSYVEASGFEATYFGNFISEGTVSRSVLVNMQGATERGGLGLTFQFYRTGDIGEVNLRPAWSRRFQLQNGNDLSFGAVVGLNYFDVTNSIFSSVNSDFVSIDGGFGIYYKADQFFAGFSVINLFEASAGLDDDAQNINPLRENPYSLHIGTVQPFIAGMKIKPVALFRYINVYQLPDQSFQNIAENYSIDLQANIFIEDTYIIGLLYGHTNADIFSNTSRFGISATYVLDNFRLTYAIQNNTQSTNSVSLPVSHLITAGYDLRNGEEESTFRYF